MARCRHLWRQRGKRERCEKCNTSFPCLIDCHHLDCRLEKGQPMPEWARFVETLK